MTAYTIAWEPGDGTRYELLCVKVAGQLVSFSYDWVFVDLFARRAFFGTTGGVLHSGYIQEKSGIDSTYRSDVLAIMAGFVANIQPIPITESGLALLDPSQVPVPTIVPIGTGDYR